ncbi:hypothetical protein [Promicromonospora sp. MEB111]|uniref:hypothetical protein n=1 Tax=Promicromonospora sp. MEB111 TaxID=3040301 RepID=UPI00255077F8|nr:hypothetical protein [Promicromonospora sp. MEB111]
MSDRVELYCVQVQHVWVSPRPGGLLAFAWFVENVTSPIFITRSLAIGTAPESGIDRWVVVVDPSAPPDALAAAQSRLREVGRRARSRYVPARVLTGLFYAWPVLFIALVATAGQAAGGDTGAAFDDATPVTLTYLAVLGIAAFVAGWLARGSVREIRELRVDRTARSAVLGRNRDVLRLISRFDQLGVVERRMFLDHLWSVATADQARSRYLAGDTPFDETEFAALRRDVEAAEAALGRWATTAQVHV